LSSVSLTVMSPSGATFDFVDSIVISISRTGPAEVEIGRLQPVPGTASISIPPTGGRGPSALHQRGRDHHREASGHMPASDTTFVGTVVVTVHV
jgi:hypothetical protein